MSLPGTQGGRKEWPTAKDISPAPNMVIKTPSFRSSNGRGSKGDKCGSAYDRILIFLVGIHQPQKTSTQTPHRHYSIMALKLRQGQNTVVYTSAGEGGSGGGGGDSFVGEVGRVELSMSGVGVSGARTWLMWVVGRGRVRGE